MIVVQKYCLVAAFVIYGLFSSPTPDTVSWAEITMGILLVLAVGIKRLAGIFSGAALWRGDKEQRFLTGCFLVLLLPPMIVGFLSGYEMRDIVRDIIPLGFFFLPLFLYDTKDRTTLLKGVVFTGVIFALRFWPASGLTLSRFGLDRGNDEMLYLTSSPAVLFSGLYLLFRATSLEQIKTWKRVVMAVASVICLLTIVATLQRAALVLSAGVIFLVFWHRVQRSPHFLMAGLMVLVTGLVIFAPIIIDIVDLIWRKTMEVGDNQRLAELHSVIAAMGDDVVSFVFGMGWGAKVMTAASGFVDVRYTHMLASYTLLKTGFIGIVAMAAYLFWLGRTVVRNLPQQPMIICAALPSFILGITLYPSFKMLCFGAILALLATKSEKSHV